MMTSGPLAGIRVKLRRADELIRQLERELEDLYRSGACHVADESDSEAVEQLDAFFDSLQIPPRLKLIAGEVLHHLRSALDHLAFQLVISNGGIPTKRTAFPILERPLPALFDRKVDGMSAAAKEMIVAWQPYHLGDRAKEVPLAILQSLDDMDKHRTPLLTKSVMFTSESYSSLAPRGPGGETSSGQLYRERVIEVVFELPNGATDETHVISRLRELLRIVRHIVGRCSVLVVTDDNGTTVT